MADEGGGREGDWECSSCSNRNYAFRSFCNRCKQPRLLVDFKTPHDSKWLPRIGDWICTGCTNNNYASREKCKKCGQPKELAAMPAVTIHGASVPSHPNYFARVQGDTHIYGSLPDDPYGLQQTSTLHLADNNISGFPFATQTNQLPPVPNGNGWRTGDWICICGFHNYSSRVQCKKCNAPTLIGTPSPLVSTSALGTKRMASEEMHNLDKKRLNAGQACGIQQSYQGYGGSQFDYIYRSAGVAPSFQANLQMLSAPGPPLILGKGAKQWRDGDWMCSNCNNHNYASRDQCNRCKSERESSAQPVSVS